MTAERAQRIASDEVPGVEWRAHSFGSDEPGLLATFPDGTIAGTPLPPPSGDSLFRHEEGARVRRAAYDLTMAWCDGVHR